MWALQAWGELALGLAAPRAVHAAGNDYGNQTLAWDVVSVSVLRFAGMVGSWVDGCTGSRERRTFRVCGMWCLLPRLGILCLSVFMFSSGALGLSAGD